MKTSHVLWAVLAAVLLSGCAKDKEIYRANCSPPDNLQWVVGNKECLKIRTLNTKVSVPDPVLVVFLHGDVSSGGPASYLFERAIWFERQDVVPVVLIRPGYYDEHGNKSTGSELRGNNYTPHNVDAVAAVVKNLEVQHRARKVVLVGHSGGAAIAGVILGRHPGVADAAVLAACPCNIDAWRLIRGGPRWSASLSPHSYAKRIPKATEVIALTGADDSNTVPSLAREYVKMLKTLGIHARFELVPAVSHNGVVKSKPFYDAVWELID